MAWLVHTVSMACQVILIQLVPSLLRTSRNQSPEVDLPPPGNARSASIFVHRQNQYLQRPVMWRDSCVPQTKITSNLTDQESRCAITEVQYNMLQRQGYEFFALSGQWRVSRGKVLPAPSLTGVIRSSLGTDIIRTYHHRYFSVPKTVPPLSHAWIPMVPIKLWVGCSGMSLGKGIDSPPVAPIWSLQTSGDYHEC